MVAGIADRAVVRIGERIQTILHRMGQSPAWLAEKAGVERSTVSRILRGDRNPTAETLSNLAPVLGYGLEDLVAGTDAAARVEDAANLVSRAHYEAAVQEIISYERKANDAGVQVAQVREALEREQERRFKAEAELQRARASEAEAAREAARHADAAERYQRALEQAVADVARLQTQVRELGQAVDKGRQTGRVAAILAGTAAIASVATYLATDGPPPAPKTRRGGAGRKKTNSKGGR